VPFKKKKKKRVIGRWVSNEWHPRTPDLALKDLFLWSTVKDKVYAKKRMNVHQPCEYTEETFQDLDEGREL
jgi:hypothetical protein